jgi:hypothetical protein
VTGTGYTATGATLTNISPTVAQNVAFVDFNDVTFTTATITAAAALIYNTSNGSKAVVVLDFGGSKTSTNGDFTIQFPAANSTSAILENIVVVRHKKLWLIILGEYIHGVKANGVNRLLM